MARLKSKRRMGERSATDRFFKLLDQINLTWHRPAMTDYRRNRVPGGTYFFTVNLYDRRRALLVKNIDILRKAVRGVRMKAPFHIDAWVVLPDHRHCLWTLPEGGVDFSARWQAIKTAFSKQIPPGEFRSASRLGKAERGIWQLPFWEHTIRDDRDYAAHMDYIHFNPVKHGLVAEAANWPYSSFHHAVSMGLYPTGWTGGGVALNEVGEASVASVPRINQRRPISSKRRSATHRFRPLIVHHSKPPPHPSTPFHCRPNRPDRAPLRPICETMNTANPRRLQPIRVSRG
jgi:putative transposase